MAGPLLKLEVMGYRDVRGRLSRRTDELARAQRDEMRAMSRGMVATLRHYAPEATGKFAEGIAYRTDDRAGRRTATFYVKGEHAFLLPFLTGGTKPHLIPRGGSAEQLAKGYPLHWIDKQTGEDRFAWSVWHPGTFPDPFVANAMEAMSPQLAMGLARMARRVAWLS
jgi:hypothetical protein